MTENKILLNDTEDLKDPVKIALKKFESHPSFIDINDKVTVESKVSICDIELEIRNSKTKKASTFMNIPTKQF